MSDLSPTNLEAPTRKEALRWSALAFALTFGLFTLIWTRYINPFYFPYGDNFSILVNSLPPFHPSASAWFLHGFQSYFDVYPDMSLHATNFIRPVVNGTFFLDWFVYGAHWSRYLLTTYAILGLIAATTCYLASYTLRLGPRIAFLITLCVVLAPSVDTGVLFDPTFAFDLLASLFIILGVAALISEALLPAWIFLLFAVFTKETALFAPPVAAVILLVRRTSKPLWNQIAITIAFLMPLLGWAILRSYDFHGEKGVYVFLDGSSHGPIHVMLVRIVLGLMTWPLAATVYWSSIPRLLSLLQKATLLLNLIFWSTLVIVGISLLIKTIRGRRATIAELAAHLRSKGERFAIVVIAVFCASSLVIPLSLNVPRRFGGIFFPLFLLCLGAAVHHAGSALLKLASVAMITSVGVVGAILILSDLIYQAPLLKSTWAMASDYVFQLSTSTEPEIFSIDDLSGRYASGEYIEKFSGYRGRLVRVNDIQWNYACGKSSQTTVEILNAGIATITSLIPVQCGDHSFNSAFPPIDPKVTSLTRDLPFAHLHYDLLRPPDIHYPGPGANLLRVQIQAFIPGSSLLISDPAHLRYRKIPLGSALNSSQ